MRETSSCLTSELNKITCIGSRWNNHSLVSLECICWSMVSLSKDTAKVVLDRTAWYRNLIRVQMVIRRWGRGSSPCVKITSICILWGWFEKFSKLKRTLIFRRRTSILVLVSTWTDTNSYIHQVSREERESNEQIYRGWRERERERGWGGEQYLRHQV